MKRRLFIALFITFLTFFFAWVWPTIPAAESATYIDPVTGRPGCEVMATALINAGWPSDLIQTMVAVSAAESGCRRDAIYKTARELSVGPLQINLRAHRWVTYACATQYHCSARAAMTIYRSPQGLRAWVVFRNGKYAAFMRAARLATANAVWHSRIAAMAKVGRD